MFFPVLGVSPQDTGMASFREKRPGGKQHVLRGKDRWSRRTKSEQWILLHGEDALPREISESIPHKGGWRRLSNAKEHTGDCGKVV